VTSRQRVVGHCCVAANESAELAWATSLSGDRLWRRIAKGICARVDQLLGGRDFLVRISKLFPALCDHLLGLLELGQRISAEFVGSFHE